MRGLFYKGGLLVLIIVLCFLMASCGNDNAVRLFDYKNIELPQDIAEVSDEDVLLSIQMQMIEKGVMVDKDENGGGIEVGDVVKLSMFVNQEAPMDVSITIGEAEIAEAVDSILLGKKAGENCSIMIDGDSYNTTIVGVGAYAESLTDAIATQYFDGKSVSEVMEETRLDIAKHRVFDYAYLNLLNNSQVTTYHADRDTYIQEMTALLRDEANAVNLSLSDYMESVYGQSLEEYTYETELFYDEYLILDALIKQEGVVITDEDYHQFVETVASDYGTDSHTLSELYPEEVLRCQLYYDVSYDLLLKYLNF